MSAIPRPLPQRALCRSARGLACPVSEEFSILPARSSIRITISGTVAARMLEDMVDTLCPGHNVIATVYVDCRSMYRAGGRSVSPGGVSNSPMRCRDERSGGYGKAQINAAIVSHANMLLGDAAKGVLEARSSPATAASHPPPSAWDSSPRSPACMRRAEGPAARSTFRNLHGTAQSSFDSWLFHPQMASLPISLPSPTQRSCRPLRRADRARPLWLDARRPSRCGRPRCRHRQMPERRGRSAALRCACSAMTSICGQSRLRGAANAWRLTSRPASRRSATTARCSRPIFRPTGPVQLSGDLQRSRLPRSTAGRKTALFQDRDGFLAAAGIRGGSPTAPHLRLTSQRLEGLIRRDSLLHIVIVPLLLDVAGRLTCTRYMSHHAPIGTDFSVARERCR